MKINLIKQESKDIIAELVSRTHIEAYRYVKSVVQHANSDPNNRIKQTKQYTTQDKYSQLSSSVH